MIKMYDEVSLFTDVVAVNSAYLDKGINGDFSESDPSDIPLLRLEVMVRAFTGYPGQEAEREGYVIPEHGEVLTLIDARTTRTRLQELLSKAIGELRTPIKNHEPLEPFMARWVTPRAC